MGWEGEVEGSRGKAGGREARGERLIGRVRVGGRRLEEEVLVEEEDDVMGK